MAVSLNELCEVGSAVAPMGGGSRDQLALVVSCLMTELRKCADGVFRGGQSKGLHVCCDFLEHGKLLTGPSHFACLAVKSIISVAITSHSTRSDDNTVVLRFCMPNSCQFLELKHMEDAHSAIESCHDMVWKARRARAIGSDHRQH